MNVRRSAAAAVSLVIGASLLSGCSAAPNRDEVVERFAIELAGTMPGDRTKDDPSIREMAANISEESPERCNDANFWRVVTSDTNPDQWDADLQYVWAASCSVLYDIDPGLESDYDAAILTQAVAE